MYIFTLLYHRDTYYINKNILIIIFNGMWKYTSFANLKKSSLSLKDILNKKGVENGNIFIL